MLRNDRGQIGTLIELLVVVAIIVFAGLWISKSYLGKGKNGAEGGPATPTQRAQGVDCANNLHQIRMAIDMYRQENDKPPASLQDLRGLSESMFKCSVSGKPLSYDPATGRVWCTTPGHGNY